MSAISAVVLNDAQATPVAHTFAPSRQGFQGNLQVASYEDRSVNSGVAVGFWKMDMEMSRPSVSRKSYRVKLKLRLPVMEVTSNSTITGIAPAPTVAYVPEVTVDVVLPERSSSQSRKDLRKMIYEALNSTQVKLAIEDLDFPI